LTAPPLEPSRRSPIERPGVYFALLVLLIGTALAAEFRSYARPDTGFLLDAASRVLGGARLYVDVVEINPPLIVALNALAVLAARAVRLSEILVYRAGFTTILLALLWLSARWLHRVLPHDHRLRRVLVVVLAFVLFPLAGPDYGEREHLVLALLVPYLLLGTARSMGLDVARREAVPVGVLAGIAFALKPHFLLVWLAIEALPRGSRRIVPRAFLSETVAISCVLATYLILVAVLTPEYFGMIRLLAGPYSRYLHESFWRLLVTGPGALLALFALLACLALRAGAGNPALWRSTALAAAACLVAGAAQQKGLRYHFYPAFGLATLLLGLVVFDLARPLRTPVRLLYRSFTVAVMAAWVVVVCLGQATAALGRVEDPGQDEFERLVRVVHAHAANEGVFVMSYHIRSTYPLINYSGAHSASRFPHLWILAADYLDALKREQPLRYHDESEMSPSERFLNRAVREDLRRRPKLLLIFRNARDIPANGYRRLDYVAYFGRDPEIGGILQEYQLIAQTGDYLIYQWTAGARRTAPAPAAAPGTHDVFSIGDGAKPMRVGDPRLLLGVLVFFGTLVTAAVSSRVRPPAGQASESVRTSG
jgi:hypothetical protein